MANQKKPTQERRVKDAMFSYHESIPNPNDPEADPVLVERTAYHGQTVDLLPHDIDRGDKHKSFFTDEEPQSGEGAKWASQFTHEQLVEWMRTAEPSTQEVTYLANEDPDPKQAAEKLIAAERESSGGDVREDLIAGLESIVSGAEAEREADNEEQRSQA